ncbi:hypothetical protein OROGR_010949 [Orobanche gracilis]
MSMSIFSSFDALCAESFFGQKISLCTCPAPSDKSTPVVESDDQKKKKKKGKDETLQPENKKEDRRRIRAPRFAPELDGVHCFETVLPY